MSTIQEPPKVRVVYPDSDGEPMAENTRQFEWIVTIKGGVDSMYRADPNVFVAGDLLWYPVEGNNKLRQAPDTMAVFGRPKGHRGSYRQWEEGGIAPQVVFEVLSPGNRFGKLREKFDFYERFGVHEYIIYDPDRHMLEAFVRRGDKLEEVAETDGWVSPLLGCKFDMSSDELVIYRPDGGRFKTFVELSAENDDYIRVVEELKQHADEEAKRAEEERLARLQAQQRADRAMQQADENRQLADRLAAKLRELGIDPDSSR